MSDRVAKFVSFLLNIEKVISGQIQAGTSPPPPKPDYIPGAHDLSIHAFWWGAKKKRQIDSRK